MKLFRKVGIIGVGLIGGSIGMELKKRRLAREVVGISFHQTSARLARKLKAVDVASLDFRELKNTDLVIFATPVGKILELAPIISKVLAKDCLVTDVGSTKSNIVAKLERLFPNYVGSHPMAGSEKQGIANARAGIFKNSLVIITPTKKTSSFARNKIKIFWQKLGAKITFISPHEHDRILSYVSHLPHVVAFSLMNTVPFDYFRFSASGLKDSTRIAASNSSLWTDILLNNSKNVIKSIADFESSIKKIKSAIKHKRTAVLCKILIEAKKRRKKLA